MVGTKTEKQCYDYYMLQLFKPMQGDKHKWTAEEQARLLEYKTSKLTWKQFQRNVFPELSISQLKNQYQDCVKQQKSV